MIEQKTVTTRNSDNVTVERQSVEAYEAPELTLVGQARDLIQGTGPNRLDWTGRHWMHLK